MWGEASIHTRQKWAAVWPHLAALPSRAPLRVLDAGCAEGGWALELAARRPAWRVTAVDREAAAIRVAERARTTLRLPNVTFAAADFADYQPATPFDVVLSASSAHYLVETGHGLMLFAAFHRWLAPGGALVLLGPRTAVEVPTVSGLPAPFAVRDVLSCDQLRILCAGAGLEVVGLHAAVGPAGTVAKQVERAAAGSRALQVATYPLQLALTALDRTAPDARRSASLVLVARRPNRQTATR